MSLRFWSSMRLHLTWSLMIPFLLSLPLTYLPLLPFHPFLQPCPIFLTSLDPPEFTFVESETFALGHSWLDQTLDDSDVEKLKDHFKVKNLILAHPMSFGFHILFDWLCLSPLPSTLRDLELHLGH